MFRIGFGLQLVGFLAVTMVGCATADEVGHPNSSGSDADPGLELDVMPSANDNGTPSKPGVNVDVDDDMNMGPGIGDPVQDPTNDDPIAVCTCGSLPGITVGDGGISVNLPNIGAVVVKPLDGTCSDATGGILVTGDVDIDLGAGTDLKLLDADIMITPGADGGLPTITGNALIGSKDLSVMLPGTDIAVDVPVAIGLDTDVDLDTGIGVALDLALELPSVSLPSGDLPSLADGSAIVDADVVVATDGASTLIAVFGTMDADATILPETVPVTVLGDLDARALIGEGKLIDLRLDGHIGLVGNELVCGLTPVAAVDLPKAKLYLDHEGLRFDAIASAGAALNPVLSAQAKADVRARITHDEFYIRVCASAVADADILDITAHAEADALICLALTPVGPQTCSCKTDGDNPEDPTYPGGEH